MDFSELFNDYTVGFTNISTKEKNLNQNEIFNTFEEAQSYIGKNNKYDIIAGRLKNGVVLIDCDNEQSCKCMDKIINYLRLKPLVIKTNRGKHYYFKYKNARYLKALSGITNAYGVQIDIKPGNGKLNCAIIFQNNKLREVLSSPEKIGYCPKELVTPLINDKEPVIPVYKITDRNDILYKQYRPAYIRANFSKEEAILCVNVMQEASLLNNYGKSKLSTKEIDCIFREPWIMPFKNKVEVNNYYEIAEIIINENNIISIENALYYYQDSYYKYCPDEVLERFVYNKNKTFSSHKRSEIIKCIKLEVRAIPRLDNDDYICFNNGILRISDTKLLPHSPEIICTTKVPHDYIDIYENPNNFNPEGLLCRTMYQWANGDMDIVQLLYELGGCCLSRDTTMQKAFVISGEKANGKSSFLHFLQFCIGHDNVSSVDMADLSDRFMKIQLKDKLANISDDIADAHLSSKTESMFKKMVTGDMISGEYKGQDVIKFRNRATLVFTCNDIPHATDTTGALARRIINIPFNNSFPEENRNFNLEKDLCTEENASAFICIAVQSYKVVKEKGLFTTSESIRKANAKYLRYNDSVLSWADEYIFEHSSDANPNCLINEPVVDLYSKYKNFAYDNGLKPLGRPKFSQKIAAVFNLVEKRVQINKERKKYFVKR